MHLNTKAHGACAQRNERNPKIIFVPLITPFPVKDCYIPVTVIRKCFTNVNMISAGGHLLVKYKVMNITNVT